MKNIFALIFIFVSIILGKTVTVGILDFQYNGDDNSKSWYGPAFMEACRVQISSQADFCVTPPRQLYIHRQNHKKGNKPSDIYNFGALLDLDFLLSGEYTVEDKSINVTMNIWDIRSGRMSSVKQSGVEDKYSSLPPKLCAAFLKTARSNVNFVEASNPIQSDKIFGIYAKAMEQYSMGNLSEAIYSARRAIDLSPNYVPALMLLTDLYISTGQEPLALETAKKAFSEAPDDCDALSVYARALLFSKDRESSLKKLKSEKAQCQNSFAFNDALGRNYLEDGMYTIAVSCFVKAISVNPGITELYYLTGKAYLGSEEYDKAIKAFSRAVELEPSNLLYRCMLGAACREGGDVVRAVKILEDIISRDPNYLPAIYHLSTCYNQLEWYKMALQVLTKAYGLHPESPDLAVGLGVTYMKMGMQKQADEFFSKAMSLDDKSPLVLNNTGVYYMERKDFKEAAKLFLRALNSDKRNPGVAYNLALTYYKMGQVKWAKQYLAIVLESSPHHLPARKLLVDLYNTTGEKENALSVLAEIISLDNSDYGAKVAYAQILLKTGEQEQGIAVMEDVVKNNPGNIEYLSLLTTAYRNLGWFDIAILKLSKFLEKNEKSAVMLTLLGEAYYCKAMTTAALDGSDQCSKGLYYLKEAYSLAGSAPETMFWYAKALYDCKRDASMARPIFQKCLNSELDPELKKEAEVYIKKK